MSLNSLISSVNSEELVSRQYMSTEEPRFPRGKIDGSYTELAIYRRSRGGYRLLFVRAPARSWIFHLITHFTIFRVLLRLPRLLFVVIRSRLYLHANRAARQVNLCARNRLRYHRTTNSTSAHLPFEIRSL